MPGPPPTPTHILKDRGSWRAMKRSGEAEPPAGLPLRPEMGEIASKIWDYYEPILINMKVLSLADGLALQMLCETYEQWYYNNEWCKKNPAKLITSVTNKNKEVIKWVEAPQAKSLSKYQEQIMRMCREFGLSPASRPNIRIMGNNKKPEAPAKRRKVT